jgi:hypothetical protein
MTTNANSGNARSRMEASSAGKCEYGGKRRWVKYWAPLGCWISPCYGLFSLGGRFETYEPLISLIFQFPWGPLWTADNWNNAYWISRYGGTPVLLFWRNILPPSCILKMVAVCCSKMLVPASHSTHCYNPSHQCFSNFFIYGTLFQTEVYYRTPPLFLNWQRRES